MVFGPLEKSQIFVGVLQLWIESNRLLIFARRFAVSSQANQNDSAEVSNLRVRWLLAFDYGENPKRLIQMILLKRLECGLQSVALGSTNGRNNPLRMGKTSDKRKKKDLHCETKQTDEFTSRRLWAGLHEFRRRLGFEVMRLSIPLRKPLRMRRRRHLLDLTEPLSLLFEFSV